MPQLYGDIQRGLQTVKCLGGYIPGRFIPTDKTILSGMPGDIGKETGAAHSLKSIYGRNVFVPVFSDGFPCYKSRLRFDDLPVFR